MNLNGIVPPLITPLLDVDTLDRAGLERLLEHVIASGVHGVFPLGSTGEGPSLGYRLRGEMVRETCRIVNGRVPVVVGITDTAFVESVALARIAEEAGADAVVFTTPYYFPTGQRELQEYVLALVAELPLPVILYNMPALSKIWFEIDTLRCLADVPNIIGVKDSSGDMSYYADLCRLREELRPDWSVLIGPEANLIESIGFGGDGGVSGGANAVPRLFVDACEAAVAGNVTRCAELQAKIEAYGKIYDIGKYASRHIKATKCAASLLGLCDDFMAMPFNRFLPEHRAQVESILRDLELMT